MAKITFLEDGSLQVDNTNGKDVVDVVIGQGWSTVARGGTKTYPIPPLTEFSVYYEGRSLLPTGDGLVEEPMSLRVRRERSSGLSAETAQELNALELGAALRRREKRIEDNILLGSSLQPATFPEVLVSLHDDTAADLELFGPTPIEGRVRLASNVAAADQANWRELQLGDVVAYAHKQASMTVAEWNDLPAPAREALVQEALDMLRLYAEPATASEVSGAFNRIPVDAVVTADPVAGSMEAAAGDDSAACAGDAPKERAA